MLAFPITRGLMCSFFTAVFLFSATALALQVNKTISVTNGTPFELSGPGWVPANLSCGWATNNTGDSANFTFSGSALYVLGDTPYTSHFPDYQVLLDDQEVPWYNDTRMEYCGDTMFVVQNLQEAEHLFSIKLVSNDHPAPDTLSFIILKSMTYTTESDPPPPSNSTTSSSMSLAPSTTPSSSVLPSSSPISPSAPTAVSSSSGGLSSPATPSTSAPSSRSSSTQEAPSVAPSSPSGNPRTSMAENHLTAIVTSPASTHANPSTLTTPSIMGDSATIQSHTSFDTEAPFPTISSTLINSSLSSSPTVQSSFVSDSPASEATPTSSSTNSTNLGHHSVNAQHKTAVVAGSTIGGLTAAAAVVALGAASASVTSVAASLTPGWVQHALITISTVLGIGAAYHTRRLIIKKHKDLKLPVTGIKIALLITTSKTGPLAFDESVVIWQVNNVTAQNGSFSVDIPCTERLKTRLFFGTYSVDSGRVTIDACEEAPATLEDQQGTIRWHRDPSESNPTFAENRTLIPTSIVLGTGSGGEESALMKPFLRIPAEQFQAGQTYEMTQKLYLRAFRVDSDWQSGQTGNEKEIPHMLEDELTKSNPIAIDELSTLTTWNITGKKGGGLCLSITPTDKKDKKQHKNECTFDETARRAPAGDHV